MIKRLDSIMRYNITLPHMMFYTESVASIL